MQYAIYLGNGIDFIMDKASEQNKMTYTKVYPSDIRVGLGLQHFYTN